MNYQHAYHELGTLYETWKPEGEIAEVLETALQSLEDCIEMHLVGDEADEWTPDE